MAQSGFPGGQSGMFSQAFQGGMHPAMQGFLQSLAGQWGGGQAGVPQGGRQAVPGASSGQSGPSATWGLGFTSPPPQGWSNGQPGQGQAGVNGWTPNTGGNSYAGRLDPNDPWGWYTQDTNANAGGQFHQQLGMAGQAGVFDPMGSTPLVNMLQQQYQNQMGGMNRQALDAARNNLTDPSTYGFASLMSQLQGQGRMADAMSQARLQSAMQNQDWLRNTWGGLLAGDIFNYLTGQRGLSINEKMAADQQNAMKHAQMGGMLGGVAGSLLGAIPGIGGAMGGMFGGMGGQQPLGYGTGISPGYLQGVADTTPWQQPALR